MRRIARLFSAALISVTLVCVPGFRTPASADDPLFIDWNSLLPSLTDEYDPTSENDCVAGRPNCLKATLREMSKSFAPLATSCSHNATFSLAYWRVTQTYGHVRDIPGYFVDTPFMNHVDAVFGKYYLRAYENWSSGRLPEVPEAWLIAFEAAKNKRVSGTGDLLLGINGHVNRDLPFVMAAVGLVAPDGTSRKYDFDKVNQFLSQVSPPLTAEEAARFDPGMASSDTPQGLGYTFSYQLVASWRERGWRNAEALVSAPTDAERAVVAAQIEADAALEAREIAAAFAYQPPLSSTTSRDAYCAVHYADPAPNPYPMGTPSAF